MHPLDVLRRPLITEKSTLLQERRKYAFEIAAKTNKAQVKEAVERAFEVKVKAVNIINIPGEMRRFGPHRKRVAGKRKAIVTLHPENSIQFFEGT